MSHDNITRDVIYFDIGKIASLFSQLRGGLTKEIQETYTKGNEGRAGLTAHVFNVGIKGNESESTTEIVQMHHDILVATENALEKDGRLIDFKSYFDNENKQTAETIHTTVNKTPYVRIEGKSEFRDFKLVKRLMDVVVRGENQSVPSSKGHRKKTSKQSIPVNHSEMIDLVVPNRIHFAVRPFSDFIAYSNLKEECILDRDMDNVLFHYGTNPNVELTVFGAVASVPSLEAHESSLFSDGIPLINDQVGRKPFNDFNQIFEAIKPLEQIRNITSYPNITVYPYAIYRTIR